MQVTRGVARYSLLTEVVCPRFGTSARKAWVQAAVERRTGTKPMSDTPTTRSTP